MTKNTIYFEVLFLTLRTCKLLMDACWRVCVLCCRLSFLQMTCSVYNWKTINGIHLICDKQIHALFYHLKNLNRVNIYRWLYFQYPKKKLSVIYCICTTDYRLGWSRSDYQIRVLRQILLKLILLTGEWEEKFNNPIT